MIIMGRVASAYGVRGWVKIQPFTEYLDSLKSFPIWHLGPEEGPWSKSEVIVCEVHGKTLVAQLDNVADRESAERLKGRLIAVPRSALPEKQADEYYWADLIGMKVVDMSGAELGAVSRLLETGANDVLCVQGEAGESLIPFVAQVVQLVDEEHRLIKVDWSPDFA